MNLFSVFDPNAFMNIPLNWCSSLVILLFIPTKFWKFNSSVLSSTKKVWNNVYGEFSPLFSSFPLSGISWMSLTLFAYIVISNSLGLAPYIFTSTSHLTNTLSLALPVWLGLYVMSWIKTPKESLGHLVPLGSPFVLSPFMVIIELISGIIRPITLSVRLAANMVAGHLLMTLVSGPLSTSSWSLLLPILIGLLCLIILESAVALIQAYVFSVLSCLYLNEVNSPKMN